MVLNSPLHIFSGFENQFHIMVFVNLEYTGCSKVVDPILNTHISETTLWIKMKLNTLYVEGLKFHWLNLQRKVQTFVGSMTDFHNCSM